MVRCKARVVPDEDTQTTCRDRQNSRRNPALSVKIRVRGIQRPIPT